VKGRISASHDSSAATAHVPEQGSITGGTVKDTFTFELGFTRYRKLASSSTCGDDHCPCLVHTIAYEDFLDMAGEIYCRDGYRFREAAQFVYDLLEPASHELGSGNASRKTRVILHLIVEHNLPTRCLTAQNVNIETGSMPVESGGQTGRSGADNQ
jgi:hypothetical protein